MEIRNVWERLRKYWAILLVLFVIIFLFNSDNGKEVPVPEENTTVSDSTDFSPERETWMTDNQYLYSKMSEKDFVAFASSTIEVKCPFYKPDGVSYRGCLYDWEESLLSGESQTSLEKINSFCETFTAKYEDLESTPGHELFSKCRIFKASTVS